MNDEQLIVQSQPGGCQGFRRYFALRKPIFFECKCPAFGAAAISAGLTETKMGKPIANQRRTLTVAFQVDAASRVEPR
ncbi:hypothetical protein SAMN04515671_1776 [Nakamurella panacisegetis]|uniref:Uncharacterized protein n=1 Tax=Nakamurella panacisegetis TaxID=1090615 RepID=A0A1H0LRK2_9ACTN|nr:hypothetical protein SAMN04515671_1776 [Nakamurella panacisegetis]